MSKNDIDGGPGSVADVLVEALCSLGVRFAFGVSGGAIAPLWDCLTRSPIRVVHCRHETGAVFAATEASLARDEPVVVFVTAGPGLSNALTGIHSARTEGARVIVFSGSTAPPLRRRHAFQESTFQALPVSGLYASGEIVHYAATPESTGEIYTAIRRIAVGLTRPAGFVAHIALPAILQGAPCPRSASRGLLFAAPPAPAPTMIAHCIELLNEGPFVTWIGHGARGAAALVRALAETTGCPVICSARAKGVFPEQHPQFVGVSGFGGHDRVQQMMRETAPRRALVLGTRLGEFTSGYVADMVPSHGFIHVDGEVDVPGSAYPEAPLVAVHADVAEFLKAVLPGLHPRRDVQLPAATTPETLTPRTTGAVRPAYLMAAVQRLVVDDSHATVLADAGNVLAWTTHHLRFAEPGRYRTSTNFSAMGHAAAGVIGAALASGHQAVAIVGDGAFLMQNEISTAVSVQCPMAWIVLNDARYNMVGQVLPHLRFDRRHIEIPPVDFAMLARSLGAEGVRVEREYDVDAALLAMLAAKRPFVVDVVIDAAQMAPVGARTAALSGNQPPKAP